jgi:O-antigen/teichoic acid export membrane protein
MPVFVGIALVAKDAVESLFGAEWEPSIWVIRIVALYWAFSFHRIAAHSLLRVTGHQGILLLLSFIACGACLASSGLTATASLSAVALGWSSRAITLPLSFVVVARLTGVAARDQLKSLVRPTVACLGMAVVVVITQAHLREVDVSATTVAFVSVLAGGSVYVGMVSVIDHPGVLRAARLFMKRR